MSHKVAEMSETNKGYLKNHCTNIRFVCTHLNELFMLNPNMSMKSHNFKNIFEQFHHSSAHDVSVKKIDATHLRIYLQVELKTIPKLRLWVSGTQVHL